MPRFKVFLTLAFLFYGLGIYLSERKNGSRKTPADLGAKRSGKVISALLVMMIFSGCSASLSRREGGNLISKSNFSFYTRDFLPATAGYLKAWKYCSDQEVKAYALYNLATTYLACGESHAAWEKYAAITDDAPDKIRFAAFYNMGIIACENGDYESGRILFQNALKIDGTNLSAKINMEMCLQKKEAMGHQNESQLTGAREDPDQQKNMNSSLFEHIKENDKKQWKNSSNSEEVDLSQDY